MILHSNISQQLRLACRRWAPTSLEPIRGILLTEPAREHWRETGSDGTALEARTVILRVADVVALEPWPSEVAGAN